MGLVTLNILSSLLAYRRSAGCDGWVRLPPRDIGARALPRTGGCALRHLFLGASRPFGFDAEDGKFYSIFLSHLVDLLSVSIYMFLVPSVHVL